MTDQYTYRTNRDLFSNHYLNDHLRKTEPWNEVPEADVQEAYTEIKDLWEDKEKRVDDYNEAQLEKNFIRPIFDILDVPFEIEETVMRNARRPDYGFFASSEAADAAFDREDFYEEAIAVADAKRWGRKLDTRGEEKRDFENPSYQIHRYLQETPPQWAVLTNGEKWRLYYGPTSHRLDSFYEIDLPKLLDAVADDGDLESFKEFYLFFRQEAFLPDQSGDCFLDDVYDESSVFAEDLGEDLQENIYEAIRVLAEGFLETNDELSEDDLDLIHDSSLIYLYRLIFVLYAESEGRNLLPTDNDIYSGSYSLNELKQTVVEERSKTQQQYQAWQTDLWDQLDELFVLIDEGSQGQDIPKDQLYIPAYNGGLFRTSPDPDDSREAVFLSDHEVGDAYIAEVIDLLTRHEADNGDGKVFVDYSSLDERNLGSIYEGLLEYTLDVADEPLTVEEGEYVGADSDDEVTVEEGEVYLLTDDGERKATGSYYTPEYVVEYIVDETLGPLVEEIREDLVSKSADTTHGRDGGFANQFAERIFDLTVLDPAMGSGHFPVNAVDYLAREIIDAQERQDRQAIDADDAEVRAPTTEEGELRDINWARRKVAQRCIYGVDVNPLATELAKVSLWLRTLAAEQPLAFLDHHLKTGNSLVGSDIEEVLTNGDDDSTEEGQLTLQESFDHTRKRAMEHVTDRFQELLAIDNETLEDAKEMEEVYDDVREDPLYQKLLSMADVHTAAEFGLDIPEDADERMAAALRDDSWGQIENQAWYRSAQTLAKEERFFHWELEFPTAFYNQEGERREDAGFDAVIGNPPYGAQFNKTEQEYLGRKYTSTGSEYDSYTFFMEEAVSLAKLGGRLSYIVPTVWTKLENNEPLRKIMLSEVDLQSILDTGDVFEGVVVETLVFCAQKNGTSQKVDIGLIDDSGTVDDRLERLANDDISWVAIQKDEFESNEGLVIDYDTADPETRKLVEKVESQSTSFGKITDISQGITPYDSYAGQDQEVIDSRAYHSDKKKDETYGKWLSGQDVSRYEISWSGEWLSYGDWLAAPREKKYFTEPRILFREVTGGVNRVIATFTKDEYYYGHSVIPALTTEANCPGETLLAIVDSRLLGWYNLIESPNAQKDTFPKMNPSDVKKLPIVNAGDIPTEDESDLVEYADRMMSLKENRRSLNLDLLDYLGNYSEGTDLPDIGLFQPTDENILNATTEDYDKLQIERARTTCDGQSVTIEATARYKPEDEDEFETDTYGYTETDFFEAFTLTELSDEEAALVEAFVPVAVEEEIGGFRDNATKTNSLIDRLKGMTLPDPDDVADDLQRYIETKERADELDAKIEKTDQLIDEIVYDLYDLTDQEIEIVEEAVADD